MSDCTKACGEGHTYAAGCCWTACAKCRHPMLYCACARHRRERRRVIRQAILCGLGLGPRRDMSPVARLKRALSAVDGSNQ